MGIDRLIIFNPVIYFLLPFAPSPILLLDIPKNPSNF